MAKRKDKGASPPPPMPPPSGPLVAGEDSASELPSLDIPFLDEDAPETPPTDKLIVPTTSPVEVPTVEVDTTALRRAMNKRPSAPRFGNRGLGWRVDPRDVRDYSVRSLFGARRGLPGAASLESFAGPVRDQLSSSSCVGQAIARAVDTRLRVLGMTGTYPSALAAYSFARALARLSPAEPFDDDGSHPRLAMKGIKDWGLPPETRWPFDMTKVNSELPLDVLQVASAYKLAAWHRVDTIGRERVLDVCQAITNKYPVILGVDADRALMAYVKGQVLTRPIEAEVVGGHMLCLLGYQTLPSGLIQVRGINSWGTSWGDRGYFWADEKWLAAPGTGDIYVLVVQGA
jgi:hypothetical protein